VYSIGAWADNRVVEITFAPLNKPSITWNTINYISVSPNNSNTSDYILSWTI